MAEEFLIEAFRRLRGRKVAEDALQEAFCRLWAGRFSPKSLREAEGTLSVTGRRIEIDIYRKECRMCPLGEAGEPTDEASPDPVEREALFRKVERAMDSELTELQKTIIRRHEYEGVPLNRIAEELSMQPAAVRMQISRARKAIREKFIQDNEKD